jgi:hypothetical protein
MVLRWNLTEKGIEQSPDGNLVRYGAYLERDRCVKYVAEKLKETLRRERHHRAYIKELEERIETLNKD